MKNRVVLDGRCDDVRAWLCHRAEDSQVIGFGSAAGEDDFRCIATEQAGDLLARDLYRGPRLPAVPVPRGCVSALPRQPRHNGFENLRQQRSGCICVEIDGAAFA